MTGSQPDFGKLFKMATEVASKIEPPKNFKPGADISEQDMSEMIKEMT